MSVAASRTAATQKVRCRSANERHQLELVAVDELAFDPHVIAAAEPAEIIDIGAARVIGQRDGHDPASCPGPQVEDAAVIVDALDRALEQLRSHRGRRNSGACTGSGMRIVSM